MLKLSSKFGLIIKAASISIGPKVIENTTFAKVVRSYRNTSYNKRFKKSNYNYTRSFPRNALLAGILSSLGITKEEPQEDPLILTIKRGILSMQREEFDMAERFLHLALKMAQERSDPEAIVYVHDIMANVAFQKGDFSKAEKLFVDVSQRLISNGTPMDDNAIVEMSLKIATMAGARGENDKAESGFKYCIDTQRKKMDQIKFSDGSNLSELDKDTIILWAMSTDWYARFLMIRGKLDEAQRRFEEALDISTKINGPSHHQTLVLMNDIGSVATLRQDYKSAIAYLSRAIEMGRSSGTPDLSAFYCNLGTTYLKSGDNQKASTYCTEALKIARKDKQKEAEDDANNCLEELKNMGYNFA